MYGGGEFGDAAMALPKEANGNATLTAEGGRTNGDGGPSKGLSTIVTLGWGKVGRRRESEQIVFRASFETSVSLFVSQIFAFLLLDTTDLTKITELTMKHEWLNWH